MLFKVYETDKVRLRKVIKIAATRCHILKLKCIKFDFGPLGELTALPRHPSWILWGLLLRIGDREGKGRGKGMGGEGKEKGGRGGMPLFKFLNTPLQYTYSLRYLILNEDSRLWLTLLKNSRTSRALFE